MRAMIYSRPAGREKREGRLFKEHGEVGQGQEERESEREKKGRILKARELKVRAKGFEWTDVKKEKKIVGVFLKV